MARSFFFILFALLATLPSCGKLIDVLNDLPALPSPAPVIEEKITIVSIEKTGSEEMQIRFFVEHARRVLQIQYKTDLNLPAWTDVPEKDGGVLFSSKDAETLTFTDKKASDPIRFYRVKVLGSY